MQRLERPRSITRTCGPKARNKFTECRSRGCSTGAGRPLGALLVLVVLPLASMLGCSSRVYLGGPSTLDGGNGAEESAGAGGGSVAHADASDGAAGQDVDAAQDVDASDRTGVGICSSGGWCWSNPLPQGNDLNGVWSSGPTDVWAVGALGTIIHWDGSAWSGVASGTGLSLTRLWGSGATDIWAVGRWEDGGGGGILHWNGTTWSTVRYTSFNLLDVWGSGPNDVWTVGNNGTMFHWNGTAWSFVEIPSVSLRGLWGSGPDDIWAVGGDDDPWATPDPNRAILHWNGTAWSSISTGMGRYLNKVWGSGPNDVWAVGEVDILHWNGTTWSSVLTGTGYLGGVWGSGPNDVWAVGGSVPSYFAKKFADGGAAPATNGTLHWNGTAWSPVAADTGALVPLITEVWGSGPNDVWAVGERGLVLHWTGGA